MEAPSIYRVSHTILVIHVYRPVSTSCEWLCIPQQRSTSHILQLLLCPFGNEDAFYFISALNRVIYKNTS